MTSRKFFFKLLAIFLISHCSKPTHCQEFGDLKRCQRQCQSTVMSGQLQLCLLDCYQGFSYVMYRTSRSYKSTSDGESRPRKDVGDDDDEEETLSTNLAKRDKKSIFVKLGKSSKSSLSSLSNPSKKVDWLDGDTLTKRSLEQFPNFVDLSDLENQPDSSTDRFQRRLENLQALNKVLEGAVRDLGEVKTGPALQTRPTVGRGRQRLAEAELGKRRNGFVRIGRWFDYADGPSFRGESKEERFNGHNIAETGKRRTGFVRIG